MIQEQINFGVAYRFGESICNREFREARILCLFHGSDDAEFAAQIGVLAITTHWASLNTPMGGQNAAR